MELRFPFQKTRVSELIYLLGFGWGFPIAFFHFISFFLLLWGNQHQKCSFLHLKNMHICHLTIYERKREEKGGGWGV